MKLKFLTYLAGAFICYAGCHSNTGTKQKEVKDSNATNGITTDTAIMSSAVEPGVSDSISAREHDTSSADLEVVAMIKKALTDDILKKDLQFLSPEEREFKYEAFDLNNDNLDEYFVSCVGPYFCGSGGCTTWLLDHNGKLINVFSVMDFPVYVAESATAGWQDLIMMSDNKLYYMKIKNGKYPGNPSVQPLIKADPATTGHVILDIYNAIYPSFSF